MLAAPILDDQAEDVVGLINQTRDHLRFMLREALPWSAHLYRDVLARNVQASTAIEGHKVSLDDVVSLIEGSTCLEASDVDCNAVSNYLDAATYVSQLTNDPHFEYSSALLRSLHFIIMRDDLSAMPGLVRPGAVGARTSGGQGVPSEDLGYEDVPSLLLELVGQLIDSNSDIEAMVRGGMTHLNMMMIHPFKDGNGRTARTVQSLVLGRERVLAPAFSSIEEYLGRNIRAYHKALAQVVSGGSIWEGDVRPWIRFVLGAHFRQAMTLSRRIRESETLWEAIDEQRQSVGLQKRTIGSLYSAAMEHRVRRPDHVRYADVSERVATSDLEKMVGVGLLKAVGERRGRHYVAGNRLRRLRHSIQEKRQPIPDPFSE